MAPKQPTTPDNTSLGLTHFQGGDKHHGLGQQHPQTRTHHHPQPHPQTRQPHLPTLRNHTTTPRNRPQKQHPRPQLQQTHQPPNTLQTLPRKENTTRSHRRKTPQTSTNTTPTTPTPRTQVNSKTTKGVGTPPTPRRSPPRKAYAEGVCTGWTSWPGWGLCAVVLPPVGLWGLR